MLQAYSKEINEEQFGQDDQCCLELKDNICQWSLLSLLFCLLFGGILVILNEFYDDRDVLSGLSSTQLQLTGVGARFGARFGHSTTHETIGHIWESKDRKNVKTLTTGNMSRTNNKDNSNNNKRMEETEIQNKDYDELEDRLLDTMQYLQHNIVNNLRFETKSNFNNDDSDNNDYESFSGFTRLSSHQCPVIRPRYQCLPINDDRAENYTIILPKNSKNNNSGNNSNENENDNDNNIKNNYFNTNLESKFMRRLFDNGNIFLNDNGDKNENISIVFWGNSHLRQLFVSLECMFYEFDFTPLKFYHYESKKQLNLYKEQNYENVNHYMADMFVQTDFDAGNLYNHSESDHRASLHVKHPYFAPCLLHAGYADDIYGIIGKFLNNTIELDFDKFSVQYTNWTSIYFDHYIDVLKTNAMKVNGNDESKVPLFLESIEKLTNTDAAIKANFVHYMHSAMGKCTDDLSQITLKLPNNDNHNKEDSNDDNNNHHYLNLYFISSNYAIEEHSLITDLKMGSKWFNKDFSDFINDIDLLVLNAGNYVKQHEREKRYDIGDTLRTELSMIKSMRLNHARRSKHNANKKKKGNDIRSIIIPTIVTGFWTYSDTTPEIKNYYENANNEWPILYYSLSSVLKRNEDLENELNNLHQKDNLFQNGPDSHFCIPGIPQKFLFTLFEMMDMVIDQY